MNKTVAVGITVTLLLNITVTLIGFSILQNEIEQLQPEEPEPSATPTPTEPTLQEPIEPEPTTTEQPTITETPTQETKHELEAPEISLNYVNIAHGEFFEANEVYEVEVEVTLTNPNNRTLYNIIITLKVHLWEWRTITPIYLFEKTETINIGALVGNTTRHITETYSYPRFSDNAIQFNGFSYTVDWDETK